MKNEFLTLTELGKLYGVSSHKVGRWLKDAGYRKENGGKPSSDSFDKGLVKQQGSTQPGTYFWVWHREKTVAALKAEGKEVLPGSQESEEKEEEDTPAETATAEPTPQYAETEA